MLSEKEIFDLLLNEADGAILDKQYFDDGAIIDFHGIHMAISTDFIRGTGFNIYSAGYLDIGDLAYYLVAANASDIASMGVHPSGFLNIFRYPLDTDKVMQENYFRGLKEAAQYYNVKIVGGDSGSYSEFVFGGTCFGFSLSNNFLYRRNAKVGDLIYVSGQPGRCRAAQIALLEIGEEKFSKDEKEYLISGWKRPNPPLTLGVYLAENTISSCGQDTSDGLGETIATICRDSRVGAILYEEKLPKNDILEKVARLSERNIYDIVLSLSPDFQLAFTIPQIAQKKFEENSEFSQNVYCIGEVTDSTDIVIQGKDGNRIIELDSCHQSREFKV